jgi:hypothetical protein
VIHEQQQREEENKEYRQGSGDEGPGRYVWPPRENVKVEDLVHDAFARTDEIHAAVSGNTVQPEVIPNNEEAMQVDADDMDEILRETTQPV